MCNSARVDCGWIALPTIIFDISEIVAGIAKGRVQNSMYRRWWWKTPRRWLVSRVGVSVRLAAMTGTIMLNYAHKNSVMVFMGTDRVSKLTLSPCLFRVTCELRGGFLCFVRCKNCAVLGSRIHLRRKDIHVVCVRCPGSETFCRLIKFLEFFKLKNTNLI